MHKAPPLKRVGIAVATVLLGLNLAACESFDIGDLFPDTKKKLPGERRAVFPEGVPGVVQGIPQELVKGNTPPPEDPNVAAIEKMKQADEQKAAEQQAAEQKAAAEEKARQAAERRRQQRAAAPKPQPQPQAQPQQSGQSAWPNQQPQQPQRPASPWPSSAQSQQPAQSAWPAPPQAGTFSR
jgi:hypothetical protein